MKFNFYLLSLISSYYYICCKTQQIYTLKLDDKIVNLNFSSYEDIVFSSDSAWLILYYKPWCGHCFNFYELWKQLAFDVINWKGVISLGSVDCDQNPHICNTHNSSSVPKVRYFPPLTRKPTSSKFFQKNTVDIMMRNLCYNLHETKRIGLAKSWPSNILPTDATNLKELWRKTQQQQLNKSQYYYPFVALTIEIADTYLGLQLILDFRKIDNKLAIFRTNHTSPLVAHVTTVRDFPAIYIIHRNMSVTRLRTVEKTRAEFRSVLTKFLNDSSSSPPSSLDRLIVTANVTLPPPKTASVQQQQQQQHHHQQNRLIVAASSVVATTTVPAKITTAAVQYQQNRSAAVTNVTLPPTTRNRTAPPSHQRLAINASVTLPSRNIIANQQQPRSTVSANSVTLLSKNATTVQRERLTTAANVSMSLKIRIKRGLCAKLPRKVSDSKNRRKVYI